MTEPRQAYILRSDAADKAPGLDESLKVPYAAALYYFAHIGDVNESEERVIAEVARDQGIDEEMLELAQETELDSAQLGALLKRVNGAYLVRDVLRIAHADGVLEEDEQRVIDQLADATGISAGKLARIKDWVDRELALRADWADMTNAD